MSTSYYKCPNCKQWYDGELCEECGYENKRTIRKKIKNKKKVKEKDDKNG